mmetsp:Transcript_53803/g.143158  ORF Transcript_53803/g.143158 Transcript_53803/m.143158 type:complete len:349 (-) Transcript_53803:785-1831(-)
MCSRPLPRALGHGHQVRKRHPGGRHEPHQHPPPGHGDRGRPAGHVVHPLEILAVRHLPGASYPADRREGPRPRAALEKGDGVGGAADGGDVVAAQGVDHVGPVGDGEVALGGDGEGGQADPGGGGGAVGVGGLAVAHRGDAPRKNPLILRLQVQRGRRHHHLVLAVHLPVLPVHHRGLLAGYHGGVHVVHVPGGPEGHGEVLAPEVGGVDAHGGVVGELVLPVGDHLHLPALPGLKQGHHPGLPHQLRLRDGHTLGMEHPEYRGAQGQQGHAVGLVLRELHHRGPGQLVDAAALPDLGRPDHPGARRVGTSISHDQAVLARQQYLASKRLAFTGEHLPGPPQDAVPLK